MLGIKLLTEVQQRRQTVVCRLDGRLHARGLGIHLRNLLSLAEIIMALKCIIAGMSGQRGGHWWGARQRFAKAVGIAARWCTIRATRTPPERSLPSPDPV